MREQILKTLESALGRKDVELGTPKEKAHGDFSLNTAMLLAHEMNKPPRKIAEELKEKIEKIDEGRTFKKVEVAGPGFINLFIRDDLIQSSLREILAKKEEYGACDIGKGKKVLLEYVSANPTGPLHVGHGRWAVIGDAISNILKTAGYSVHREFYVNNIGRQVELLIESVNAVKNSEEVPEGGYGGAYIKEIADEVASRKPADPRQFILDKIISGQKETLLSAGVEFDTWFFENTLHESDAVDKIIEKLEGSDATYEKDGAIWFKSTGFGDDKDRVLIRENKEPTYFAADITYHADKFKRGFDLLINVWGTDHHGYVKRLHAALDALHLPSADLEIIIGQLVTIYRGKEPVRMSKRTGDIVTFKEVIEEIGPDAARFFLLMTSADSHMDFDLELASSQSMENPVYYVQYAHARLCNILKNTSMSLSELNDAPLELLSENVERELVRKLIDYPEEVKKCASSLEPHHLIRYCREVASLLHSYYHKCRVISKDVPIMKARLVLTKATRIVLSNVLKLLGVCAPERM